jgi:hypothetical protein
MKITNVKAIVAKGLTIGVLAGAFVLEAPAKAEAQQFAIGVQFGTSHYDYRGRDPYDRVRWEQSRRQQAFAEQQAYERQQAWARHEAWERQRDYGRYDNGYRRGHERDHDDRR